MGEEMKICYLLQDVQKIWGGVKTVLEEANILTERGHHVTIIAQSPAPSWINLKCDFIQAEQFTHDTVPECDLVVGTLFTTIRGAVECRRGIPVHYCQGYELDYTSDPEYQKYVHEAYRLPAEKITIASHLTAKLKRNYNIDAHEITYWANSKNLYPGEFRKIERPVRIGIVGPAELGWKDIITGLRALDLLHRSGLEFICVRITNTEPIEVEKQLDFPLEWHQQVNPDDMANLYRSMDIFLGTSRGDEEGFFMPAVEALSCGIPAVLTDIPCFRGYGEGEYTLFVPPKDPAAMAKAILEIIGSEERQKRLRSEALTLAEKYRPEHHIDSLENLFREILAEG